MNSGKLRYFLNNKKLKVAYKSEKLKKNWYAAISLIHKWSFKLITGKNSPI